MKNLMEIVDKGLISIMRGQQYVFLLSFEPTNMKTKGFQWPKMTCCM